MTELKAHMNRTHPDEGKITYKCVQCSKFLASKSSLGHHMKAHLGNKSESCTFCKRTFIDKSGLMRHISIHTGTKNYKCDLCDKMFRTPKQVRCHRRIHFEKQVDCTLCEKKFSCEKSAKEHKSRVHMTHGKILSEWKCSWVDLKTQFPGRHYSLRIF